MTSTTALPGTTALSSTAALSNSTALPGTTTRPVERRRATDISLVPWVSDLLADHPAATAVVTSAGEVVWGNDAYWALQAPTAQGATSTPMPAPDAHLSIVHFPLPAVDSVTAHRAEQLRTALNRVLGDLRSLPGATEPADTLGEGPDDVPNEPRPLPSDLRGRRRLVAELAVQGMPVVTIAEQLSISPNTVRNHLKAAFHQLDVRSRAELIARYRAW